MNYKLFKNKVDSRSSISEHFVRAACKSINRWTNFISPLYSNRLWYLRFASPDTACKLPGSSNTACLCRSTYNTTPCSSNVSIEMFSLLHRKRRHESVLKRFPKLISSLERSLSCKQPSLPKGIREQIRHYRSWSQHSCVH